MSLKKSATGQAVAGARSKQMDVRKMQKLVVAALEDIKGRDITVLNVTKLTAMFDRVVIATADSTRQVKALARNVQDKLREAGAHAVGVEGEESGEWVLVDLGSVVVHIMQPAVRAYYNLEELWDGDAVSKKPRRAA
jgi:ribosome-associated protein